jgi:hypothetical protein
LILASQQMASVADETVEKREERRLSKPDLFS